MLSDNVIIELYELSRNMNWLNGCALIWHWNGYGSEPWWNQIRLSLLSILFLAWRWKVRWNPSWMGS